MEAMEKPFVHLHNHSDFSLLDGSARVEGLAAMAKEYGMPAVALTDHGNLLGALYFERACRAAGVKPIIGCEVYLAPKSRHERTGAANDERRYYHMCLFAKNETGYKNLLILTSTAYTEGFYYRPRIDNELLEQYHEGLIASSACLAGEIAYHLVSGRYNEAKSRALYYENLFGKGNYYLEVQDHGFPEDVILRREIKKLAAETGIPLIATNDVHYLRKEDESDNDIFICIGTQSKRNDTDRMRASPNSYFRSPDEMYELFADMPEALANTVELAEKCNVSIPQPGPLLPEYQIPENYSSNEEYLRHLVMEGIKKRYAVVTDDIRERAEFELKTIIQMGFVGYFLIVWDFIDWAKNHGISVGPGRGSGAGSIVAYALRITDIDPLKYNLLFERFLNPDRVSMPDFDIDFNDERRGEVIDYVTEKYGSHHVAGIATYSTLKTKAALKDVARVLDIPYAESLAITKAVPDDLPKLTVKKALEASKELQAFAEKGGVYAELFEVAARIEGLVRGTGVHACGKVIGRSPIVDYVPLVVDPKDKTIITAFESKLIEDCGLVKMDFLGLITLSIIDRTVEMIRKDRPEFDIGAIPEDDKKVFKMFSQGTTAAVFQFESGGMQKVLRETEPESIEDLIALNSLYRPGPMDYIPDFVEGKRAPHRVVYDHDSLVEVLKPTYGVIVYQEQVMQVAQIYAGYSLGAADLLRRAMGKKKPEEMAKQKSIFIEGAVKNGHKAEDAEKLFEKLAKFAGYGFNKSHAACYSVLAYQTAYLKTHFPAQFMAANLTKFINSPGSFSMYLDEARGMGLEILPPDINFSAADFSADHGKIYYGFLGMKGVGEAAVNEIISARREKGAFGGFIDFLEKIPLQSVNKRVIEILIQAGLFDSCEKEYNRGELLANFDAAIDWATRKKASEKSGPGLFDMFAEELSYPPYKFNRTADITLDEKLMREKEILGFYISGHPLDKYKGAWQHQPARLNLAKVDEAIERKEYTIVGILKNVVIRQTKRGDKMATASAEDFNGTVNIVVFSKTLENAEALLVENSAVFLKGKVDKSRGEPQFRVDEVSLPDPTVKPSERYRPAVTELHIYLKEEPSQQDLLGLREVISNNQGAALLFFHIKEGTEEKIVKGGRLFKTSGSEEALNEIKKHPVVRSVAMA
jgi:DNA polymerase-3 subunit alpha